MQLICIRHTCIYIYICIHACCGPVGQGAGLGLNPPQDVINAESAQSRVGRLGAGADGFFGGRLFSYARSTIVAFRYDFKEDQKGFFRANILKLW